MFEKCLTLIFYPLLFQMKVFAVLASVLAAAAAAPQLPAGLSAAICPNYPFCDVGGAAAIPGAALVAQQAQTLQYGDLEPLNVTPEWDAAQAEQLARMGIVPGALRHAGKEARVIQAQQELLAAQACWPACA